MQGKQMVGAVIGCGQIAKLHLNSMKEAGYRIGVLCDIEPNRAESRKAEFGDDETKTCTDIAEALGDERVDVVAVLTPPYLHKEQIIASLEAGKYVYSEKPVVAKLCEFDEILAAERDSGRQAFYTTSRFRGGEGPLIMQYVQDGDLGEIYRVEAKHIRSRGRPGVDTNLDSRWFADSTKALAGITGDMGLYLMDRSFHFTGWPEATAVSAAAHKLFPFEMPEGAPYDVEEHIVMFVRTAGELTFSFEFANIAHHEQLTGFTMLGTKGGIQTNKHNGSFRYRTEKGGPWQFVEHTSTWRERKKPDTVVYEQLARAITEDAPVSAGTTTDQARILHTVMAMAYRSAREQREVTVSELDHNVPIFAPCWTVREVA
jgi:predicted dehydrogenase